MLECPKCKSKNVSVVPIVKSERNTGEGFKGIQILCIVILILAFIFFVAAALDDTKAFSRFIGDTVSTQSNSSSSTNNSSGSINGGITAPTRGGLSDYVTLCLCAWIMRWTLIILLLVTVAKSIIPYRTTTQITFLCHECDLHWKKPKKIEQEDGNADD